MTLAATTVAPWISASFPYIRLVLLIVMVILSLCMIVCVLMQQAKSAGLSAISGGQESFFGTKQKGRNFEGTMKKATIGFAIALVVICILFSATQLIYPATLA